MIRNSNSSLLVCSAVGSVPLCLSDQDTGQKHLCKTWVLLEAFPNLSKVKKTLTHLRDKTSQIICYACCYYSKFIDRIWLTFGDEMPFKMLQRRSPTPNQE